MLEQVVGFIQQDFLDSGCPAPVRFGTQYLADHTAPNRVVIVPTTDKFTTRQASSGTSSGRLIGQNPKAIFTQLSSCDVHIWAASEDVPNGQDQLLADYAYLRALINQTVLSFFRNGFGITTFDGGTYSDTAVHVRHGLSYILKVTMEFSIFDVDYTPPTLGKTFDEVSNVAAEITTQVQKPDRTVMGSVTFSTRNS